MGEMVKIYQQAGWNNFLFNLCGITYKYKLLNLKYVYFW